MLPDHGKRGAFLAHLSGFLYPTQSVADNLGRMNRRTRLSGKQMPFSFPRLNWSNKLIEHLLKVREFDVSQGN